MTLGPYETYSATFECAGIEASGSANDVEVERNSSDEDVVVKSFQTYWQQFGINAQGTLRVQKLGNWVQRGTNTVTFINGVVQ